MVDGFGGAFCTEIFLPSHLLEIGHRREAPVALVEYRGQLTGPLGEQAFSWLGKNTAT